MILGAADPFDCASEGQAQNDSRKGDCRGEEKNIQSFDPAQDRGPGARFVKRILRPSSGQVS